MKKLIGMTLILFLGGLSLLLHLNSSPAAMDDHADWAFVAALPAWSV